MNQIYEISANIALTGTIIVFIESVVLKYILE